MNKEHPAEIIAHNICAARNDNESIQLLVIVGTRGYIVGPPVDISFSITLVQAQGLYALLGDLLRQEPRKNKDRSAREGD